MSPKVWCLLGTGSTGQHGVEVEGRDAHGGLVGAPGLLVGVDACSAIITHNSLSFRTIPNHLKSRFLRHVDFSFIKSGLNHASKMVPAYPWCRSTAMRSAWRRLSCAVPAARPKTFKNN